MRLRLTQVLGRRTWWRRFSGGSTSACACAGAPAPLPLLALAAPCAGASPAPELHQRLAVPALHLRKFALCRGAWASAAWPHQELPLGYSAHIAHKEDHMLQC